MNTKGKKLKWSFRLFWVKIYKIEAPEVEFAYEEASAVNFEWIKVKRNRREAQNWNWLKKEASEVNSNQSQALKTAKTAFLFTF